MIFAQMPFALPAKGYLYSQPCQDSGSTVRFCNCKKKKIIDVPGVPGREAWDEYESIYRYILSNDEIIPSGPSELELLREKVA
jgi:hypothetical protein